MRVGGQLPELRDRQLRFSAEESALFLNQTMNIELSPADIGALEARTEGWIAGLQLAALSMQGRADTHDFVQAFTGSHRYVIDYLAEEILNQQPPHIRAFLMRTAILDRLCSPLCDAVLSAANDVDVADSDAISTSALATMSSQEMLEYLEQAQLFLVPLDDERRWYRYQHLFADFLREYLVQNSSRSQIVALHRRAGHWFAENHAISEAIAHVLAAGDVQEATILIEQVIIEALTGGEVATVQNWLSALPEANILARLLRQISGRGMAENEAYLKTVLAAFEASLPKYSGVTGQPQSRTAAQDVMIEPLSERELEVLRLVADGLTNREIAEKLYITVGTAKTHTINIYRKLNVRSRTQAVALGQELGIL